MALSQKHRNALFAHFSPRLGEDVTEAFLAEFPAREGDELVTRSHQRAELAEVRRDMAEFRAEVGVRLAELRTEVHEQAAATNRRLTTVVLTATGLLIAAGGVMTTIVVTALR